MPSIKTTVALLAILSLYLKSVLAFSSQTFIHDSTTSNKVPTPTPTPTPTALLETTSPFDREDALQAEQRQVCPTNKTFYSQTYLALVLTIPALETMRWDLYPWALLLHPLPLVSL
ncbi:hypothetical protein BDV33DRAFT_198657 [Aspergillus novoparasiticus]|uniref:Uncharacterized protein n=1 Tax=Aspergillus novoparasiticus TaxID=986946 RepID=A0A5N6F5W3_9EURO|nr:hypothetical protein BDV33DRAFT_198657 [Aspergillus novoparasiticus]